MTLCRRRWLNDLQYLIAKSLHGLLGISLHIDSQQGLGVGGANIEPAVREAGGHTVEFINFGSGRREVHRDAVDRARFVRDFQVDLTAAESWIERGDDLGERFTGLRH